MRHLLMSASVPGGLNPCYALMSASTCRWMFAVLFALSPMTAMGGTVVIAHRMDASIEGEEFSEFGGPVLNDASQVAFVGRIGSALANADTGVFLDEGGGLQFLAREGSRMMGFADRFHDDLLNDASRAELAMNNVGQVAFWTRDQSDNSFEAIYAWDGVLMRPQIFSNHSAPDGNGFFTAFSRSIGIAEFGGVIYRAEIEVADISQSGIMGIFIREKIVTGSTFRIVRDGDIEASSLEPVALCGVNSPCGRDFGFNANGNVANYAFVVNPSFLNRVQRNFASGPPVAVGQEFGAWAINGLVMTGLGLDPSVNDQFEVAFTAGVGGGSFSTTPKVVLRKRNETGFGATQVALTDDPAPDGNGVLAQMFRPVINNASQVAFVSYFWQTADAPNDISGILLSTDDVPAIIARQGDLAPGGGIFSAMVDAEFALSHTGLVAYQADLHGLPVQQQVVFLSDGTETLEVVRTGDPLLDSTIESIEFVGGNSRQRTGLNDFGQVAYRVSLTNDLEAIALFTPDALWRTGLSGNWDDANNWRLNIPPAGVHDTIVDSATLITVAGPSSDTSVNALTIGPGPVEMVLPAGSHVQCNGQFELSDNAKLTLEVSESSPTSASRFDVTGDAILSGEFELATTGGFVPLPAQQFDVISTDTGTIQGQVTDVQGIFAYVVQYTPTSMVVTVLPRAGDLDTWAAFSACASSVDTPPDPDGSFTPDGCLTAFDTDEDGDVDLLDYADLQVFFE